MAITPYSAEDRVIRFGKAPQIHGLSLSTQKILCNDPNSDFPRPFVLTDGTRAFMLSTLLSWVEKRAKASKAAQDAKDDAKAAKSGRAA